MTTNNAIKEMKKIEVILNNLKKNGFSVYLQDNDKIVLESPEKKRKNYDTFQRANNQYYNGVDLLGEDRRTFSSFTDDLQYDYEITF